MKKRIEKLENRQRESQRGIIIINSSEWQAVWGDEADPNDKFVAEWKEEMADKLIIIDDVRKAPQTKPGGPGEKPGDNSNSRQGKE